MKFWVMRLFGGLNLAFGIAGFLYSGLMLSRTWRDLPGTRSEIAWIVFLSVLTVGTLLVGSLFYLGIRLLARDESAIRSTATLFGFEMCFFAIYVIIFWIVIPANEGYWPGLAGHLLGMMQGPLVPQIVTGYPLFGLLAMLLIKPGRDNAGALKR
jgi:hypothetical protein